MKKSKPSTPVVGAPAPVISAVDHSGNPFRLADHLGKKVVLYFYPKADTPGCTKEACGFRDTSPEYAKFNAVVVGVSPDKPSAQAKFRNKYSLPFPLLADEDHAVAEAYGAWKEKSMYGRKYMGVERTTFLIDEEGKIARIWEKVKPEAHAAEVLEALQSV